MADPVVIHIAGIEGHEMTNFIERSSEVGGHKFSDDVIRYVTSVDTIDDYFCMDIAIHRTAAGKTTIVRTVDLVLNDQSTIVDKLRTMYPSWLMVQVPGYRTNIIGIDRENDAVLFANNRNRGIMQISLTGAPEWCDATRAKLLTEFVETTSFVEWVYNPDGSSIRIPLNTEHLPAECMYPWLRGRTLSDYYNSFMKSSANILLLLGVPGSGKTTFIRGLLHETKSSAVVTYDPNILSRDNFFSQFLESRETNIIVLEDADNFMRSRADGNDMMHRFLNLGDGLVSTSNKKMIFSTNLPSLHDVDEALMRPGRCFDMVEFGELTGKEAMAVSAHFGGKFTPEKNKKYTLAEILNNNKFTTPDEDDIKSHASFGFCPE